MTVYNDVSVYCAFFVNFWHVFWLGLVAFLVDFWGPFWETKKGPFFGPLLLWLKAVVPFSGPKNGGAKGEGQ